MKKLAITPLCVAILMVILPGLASCSSDTDNLSKAASICNGTLKQAKDQNFPAMVRRDSRNADRAAKLANDDDRYTGLADAVDNTASLDKEARDAMKAMITDDTGVATQRAQEVLNDITDGKRELLTECRKVKARGGAVSRELMNNYIK